MKNFTQYALVVFISCLSLLSDAQTFGIKGGFNLSNLKDSYADGNSYGNVMNPGFHIGGTIDLPFNKLLSLESGLLFTTKGYKIDGDVWGMEMTQKANLYYIDLPITLKASFPVGENVKLFAATGPYVGLGLIGTVKTKVTYEGETDIETDPLIFGDDLSSLDYGVTFGGGIEIKAFQIGASYDLGLADISGGGFGTLNRVLKFSVGYRFGK